MSIVKGTGPIEVWLRQSNMQITGMLVGEDERTEDVEIDSLSIRGAEREVTGWLIDHGYEPAGRWLMRNEEYGEPREVSRKFRRPSAK
jgi:hypothetical protein